MCRRVGLKRHRLGRGAVARTPLRVRTGASFAIHEESIVLHVVGGWGGVLPPVASHFTAASAQTARGAPWGRAGALQLVSTITVAPRVVFAFTPFFLIYWNKIPS